MSKIKKLFHSKAKLTLKISALVLALFAVVYGGGSAKAAAKALLSLSASEQKDHKQPGGKSVCTYDIATNNH